MDLVERFQIALRREGESDQIGSFVQGIMPQFFENFDNKYGDDIDDKDIIQTAVKDFTIHKILGFDSTWAGTPGGSRKFTEESDKLYKKMNDELPEEKKKRGYRINRNGGLEHLGILNGFSYTFLHEGILKTEELFNEWYGGSYISDPPKNAVEYVNSSLKLALESRILPIFSTGLLVEPLIGSISIAAAGKWSRKKPNFLKDVFNELIKPSIQRMEILCQSEAPIIIIPDDCAYKSGVIFSPKFYREFILPHFKKLVDMAHKKDKLVIMHSDGYLEPYYPLLIEIGVDAHESLEPAANMDLKHLKETYGDKLTLIGNVDCSRLLPFGTREEVIEATKRCIKDGGPGGGYIFSPCTDLTNSCKLENVEAMMETYKKYRSYPLKF